MNSNTAIQDKPEIRAEYLGAEDLKIAASLLYQAYHDDPLFLEIFNGEKDVYDERDNPDPMGNYAKSKYLG